MRRWGRWRMGNECMHESEHFLEREDTKATFPLSLWGMMKRKMEKRNRRLTLGKREMKKRSMLEDEIARALSSSLLCPSRLFDLSFLWYVWHEWLGLLQDFSLSLFPFWKGEGEWERKGINSEMWELGSNIFRLFSSVLLSWIYYQNWIFLNGFPCHPSLAVLA